MASHSEEPRWATKVPAITATPWIYWLCVVLVSILGTQLTDFFTDTLGVSLYLSTAVFSVTLAVVFAVWYRQEGTLAIASINTPRREGFYWAAILTTFALGTAAGDLATEALNLGFRNGTFIFGGLILATWIALRLGAGQVLTFWIAYVLTRPLGASLGDLLTQDKDLGGLALGASVTSALFLAAIVVLVAREQVLVSRHGVAEKGAAPRGHEVAWDDAEAGLKPRDSAKWHQLDDQIDAVLTALRASHPSRTGCASAVAGLMKTLNTFDGV
ncbi:hypothetical protein [Dactylosporangium sp. NPDC049140]|uniref:COG4705 family protein n=1 Tax=Dactylosporangium sp. NPDC049140 TaxID=3155647 RepID=UPI00340AC628